MNTHMNTHGYSCTALAFLQLHLVFVSSRFAKYYQSEDGTEYRTLHKAYAIHFEIIVSGNVGILYSHPIRYIYKAAYVTHMGLCVSNFAYLFAGGKV